jgi:hypothetical protein
MLQRQDISALEHYSNGQRMTHTLTLQNINLVAVFTGVVHLSSDESEPALAYNDFGSIKRSDHPHESISKREAIGSHGPTRLQPQTHPPDRPRRPAGLAVCGVLVVVFALAMAYPNLPALDTLTDYRPKMPLRIFTADNVLIGEFGEERRTLVRFKDIPT